jgi:hypothetical protein
VYPINTLHVNCYLKILLSGECNLWWYYSHALFIQKRENVCKYPMRRNCCILWCPLSEKTLVLGQSCLTKIHVAKVTAPWYFFISLLCQWPRGVGWESHCHRYSPTVKRASFEIFTLYNWVRAGEVVVKLTFFQLWAKFWKFLFLPGETMWHPETCDFERPSAEIVKSPHHRSFWSSSLHVL